MALPEHSQQFVTPLSCHCQAAFSEIDNLHYNQQCWGVTSSLSVGHYELCRDDIGDLPGSPEHL